MFGSRLVHVSTAGTEIQVKTDGKSMPIGEFIDKVTPLELQKFECREPIMRLTGKGGGGGKDQLSQIDESMMLTIDAKSAAGKSIKRLNSKASVRTSATKTPVKRRGN